LSSFSITPPHLNKLLNNKQRINSKYRKKYDAPQPPYQRVMASAQVTSKAKEHLKTVHQSLNPFILKQDIEKKLQAISSM